MVTRWDLNPIVLCHCRHFYRAAADVVDDWTDEEAEDTALLVSLLGNMLWVYSGVQDEPGPEHDAMAVTGALGSTLAGRLTANPSAKASAAGFVSALECHALAHHDELVDAMLAELGDQDLPPSEVNRRVWESMFPQYPYATGTLELRDAIRCRIARLLEA